MKYTCHSGGCPGSDLAWEVLGEEYGVHTISYSFKNHINKGKNPYIISYDELTDEGWPHVQKASKALNRSLSPWWPPFYVQNLLSRNWWQIKNSDSVFAIGFFEDDKKERVKGGTGWAVQMAIDCQDNRPIFLFDQDSEKWYVYNPASRGFIQYYDTPVLTRNFAGIGTRQLKDSGLFAIHDVYKATFEKVS